MYVLNLDSLPSLLREGWQEIRAGIQGGDQNKVWVGNTKLLQYEQSVTLQKYVYDVDRALWKELTQIDREKWSFLRSPSGVSFMDVKPNGDFGQFSDRWEWIGKAIVQPSQKLDSASSISGPERGRSMVDQVGRVRVETIEEIRRLESLYPYRKLKSLQKPTCQKLSSVAPGPIKNLRVE